MVARPDLAGQRLQKPGNPAIWLIDCDGLKRWIPDPDTYNNLFRDWNGIVQDTELDNITPGHPISHGALLAKDPNTAPVWLVDHDLHVKRWVSSPAAMDQFHFNWDKIQQVSNFVLDAIWSGNQIC